MVLLSLIPWLYHFIDFPVPLLHLLKCLESVVSIRAQFEALICSPVVPCYRRLYQGIHDARFTCTVFQFADAKFNWMKKQWYTKDKCVIFIELCKEDLLMVLVNFSLYITQAWIARKLSVPCQFRTSLWLRYNLSQIWTLPFFLHHIEDMSIR